MGPLGSGNRAISLAPLSYAVEGPLLLLHGVWNTEACGTLTHILKQNKGGLTESEIEKDVPIQGDKPCIVCVGTLSLGKEVFQAKDLFFCGGMGVLKTAHEAAFFPNKYAKKIFH